MKHSVSTRKELTILKLEEAVFDVRYADWFRTTIDNMVGNALSKNVIIDFSQVKAIDSSGIGSMLLAHQLANRSDGLAIFVSLCQQIKDLLKLTNLDKQLYIFSSINEVMTLIEPALKGKRGAKSRQQTVQEDVIGDIADEIDILPDEVFDNASFPEMDEESVVSDSDDEEEMTDKEKERDDFDDNEENEEEERPRKTEKKPKSDHQPKKRGRPKKNPDSGKEKLNSN
jgi:anti-anti-sigma factor